jgi:hypothetical protein
MRNSATEATYPHICRVSTSTAGIAQIAQWRRQGTKAAKGTFRSILAKGTKRTDRTNRTYRPDSERDISDNPVFGVTIYPLHDRSGDLNGISGNYSGELRKSDIRVTKATNRTPMGKKNLLLP